MDANGTRFHLILGKDDWSRCTDCSNEQSLALLADAWQRSAAGGDTVLEWDAQLLEFTLQPRLFSDKTELEWDVNRYELTLRSRLFQLPTTKEQKQALDISNRRGADRDRYGNWYWIDETGSEIRVNSVGTGLTSHFWSIGDGLECEASQHSQGDFQPAEPKPPITPLQLSGLAVTEDHYLVVGTLQPAGLLIFDLYAGGTPRQLFWPRQVKFAPFDMAAAPGGGV